MSALNVAKVESLLRRLQGELILFERQLDHFSKIIEECFINTCLFNALIDGHAVRTDINILDVECKVAALKYRARQFRTDLMSTIKSLEKLFKEASESSLIKELGLDKFVKEQAENPKKEKAAIERMLEILDKTRPSTEEMNFELLKQRYQINKPDITPLIEAFISSSPT